MTPSRNTITLGYARVCKDSGHTLSYDRAAALLAGVLGIHPLEVWIACGTMDSMLRIANGTHPCLGNLDQLEAAWLEEHASQMRENANP
jgi:hypothetical protein